ncbi:hypothetical protein BCV71DRAFT_233668 [Rhizopus microsporus]|uniref:Uncharacterized protein n=1 Tax=Rhizopus microsporus TaxID=58291 RepID=A0A1X0S693_RHIZD|nr:hypothetical protein BCV71DRAFT_233668 [Rhizopus microsporus]
MLYFSISYKLKLNKQRLRADSNDTGIPRVMPLDYNILSHLVLKLQCYSYLRPLRIYVPMAALQVKELRISVNTKKNMKNRNDDAGIKDQPGTAWQLSFSAPSINKLELDCIVSISVLIIMDQNLGTFPAVMDKLIGDLSCGLLVALGQMELLLGF